MTALAKCDVEAVENRTAFPPEADCEFDVVQVEEISAWRERLNERFGIGKGILVPVDDPATEAAD